jgi:hypothetical protein
MQSLSRNRYRKASYREGQNVKMRDRERKRDSAVHPRSPVLKSHVCILCRRASFGRVPNSLIFWITDNPPPSRAQARSARVCARPCHFGGQGPPGTHFSCDTPQVHGCSWLTMQCAGSSLAVRGTNSTRPRAETCQLHPLDRFKGETAMISHSPPPAWTSKEKAKRNQEQKEMGMAAGMYRVRCTYASNYGTTLDYTTYTPVRSQDRHNEVNDVIRSTTSIAGFPLGQPGDP